jgi:hypothetical protein
MTPYKELKYNILKYVDKHIESRRTLILRYVLEQIGEDSLVENSSGDTPKFKTVS